MKNQTYEINRTFIRERISKFLSFLILRSKKQTRNENIHGREFKNLLN